MSKNFPTTSVIYLNFLNFTKFTNCFSLTISPREVLTKIEFFSLIENAFVDKVLIVYKRYM